MKKRFNTGLSGNTEKELGTRSMIMTGLIIPARWDDDGNVTGVAVSTASENVTLAGHGIAITELLQLIHKEVEIQGYVDHDPLGKRLLVDNYKIKKRKLKKPYL